MRDIPGRRIPVNGRTVHIEETGDGDERVVFEAGAGCGRTCWDPLLPFLDSRLVTYDRARDARSVDEMAADLTALIDVVAPAPFVLVAHSMGGLIARRAAPARMRALLLIDPLPETAPVYDTWDRTTDRIDRTLAAAQALSRFPPVARLLSGNVRHLYPADTYRTMLAEDFTPAGIARTRTEMRAVAAAIPRFRADPPAPPACPVIVLSANRARRGRESQHAAIREHQERYAGSLPDGRFEPVDAGHLIQAEQPELVAARIRELQASTRVR